MLIAYCSDLHLEHSPIDYDVLLEKHADVLILAGDTVPIRTVISQFDQNKLSGDDVKVFFEIISNKFKHIIYVTGNHEFYGCNINDTYKLKFVLSEFPNIYILDKESISINGVDFFGGTLWTDFNNQDPTTLLIAPNSMMDYRCIKQNVNEVLTTDTILRKHQSFIDKFKSWLTLPKEHAIVISHHSPALETTNDEYASKHYMNGLFSSNLKSLIEENKLDYWIYGHQHTGKTLQINNCTITTNARGYPLELSHYNFKMKYIKI
jgi:Icc-related predicted phosphoesterase